MATPLWVGIAVGSSIVLFLIGLVLRVFMVRKPPAIDLNRDNSTITIAAVTTPTNEREDLLRMTHSSVYGMVSNKMTKSSVCEMANKQMTRSSVYETADTQMTKSSVYGMADKQMARNSVFRLAERKTEGQAENPAYIEVVKIYENPAGTTKDLWKPSRNNYGSASQFWIVRTQTSYCTPRDECVEFFYWSLSKSGV